MRRKWGHLCWLAITLGAVSLTSHAQKLEHVGSFWGFNDVQFLPGGYVQEDSDGYITSFVYKNSKFRRYRGEVPAPPKNWIWVDRADFSDKIDLSATLRHSLRSLLPRQAKVKKYHKIFRSADDSGLVLICYTMPLQTEDLDPTAIFLAAVTFSNLPDGHTRYHKLWTRKLVSRVSYADFSYQAVPGEGTLILLYSQDVGGDSVEYNLDVYRLKDPKPPGGAADNQSGVTQLRIP